MKPLATLTVAAVLTGRAALAFADDATDIATARALGQDGVMLADQGKCPQAIEKLARAEKLHHAPTTALRLAECEIEVGRLVAGTERLERLVREPLAPSAPAAFTAAQARAQTVLGSAQPRIATLHITVKAPAGTAYTVTVDDEPVPGAMIDADRPTDPGTRKLAASAKGFRPASAEVTLKEGESSSAQLTLEPDPNAVAESAASTETTRSTTPEGGRSIVPWIAIGVGVAGVALGAVSGAIVASKASDLSDTCPNNRCPAGSQDKIDSASSWATVSTVGFVVGGVGIASGVVMLLLGKPSGSPSKAAAGVKPVIGARYLGLDGRF